MLPDTKRHRKVRIPMVDGEESNKKAHKNGTVRRL